MDWVAALSEGGLPLHLVLVCGVTALAIAVERTLYLVFRASIDPRLFVPQMRKLVLANNIDRAIKLCNAEPYAALPRVFKAGLVNANCTEREIADAVKESVLEQVPLLRRRTSHLLMLGIVAALLGLLGTVEDLMAVYGSTAEIAPGHGPPLPALGIASSLRALYAGLFVSIPCFVAHSFIRERAERILDEIEVYGLGFANLLSARRRGELPETEGLES